MARDVTGPFDQTDHLLSYDPPRARGQPYFGIAGETRDLGGIVPGKVFRLYQGEKNPDHPAVEGRRDPLRGDIADILDDRLDLDDILDDDTPDISDYLEEDDPLEEFLEEYDEDDDVREQQRQVHYDRLKDIPPQEQRDTQGCYIAPTHDRNVDADELTVDTVAETALSDRFMVTGTPEPVAAGHSVRYLLPVEYLEGSKEGVEWRISLQNVGVLPYGTDGSDLLYDAWNALIIVPEDTPDAVKDL